MHIKSVKFTNFKGMKDYSATLHEINVLVGPNNAGKSTVLDAFRALSAALRHARRRNPTLVSFGGKALLGHDIPVGTLPISLTNIHSDYNTEEEASVLFTLGNGRKLRLTFIESSKCVMTFEDDGPHPKSTSQFRTLYPVDITTFPTLGPLEEEEELLTPEHVERHRLSRRSHRMFRNIWYHNRQNFEHFRELVASTWPGMTVHLPERQGFAPPMLVMFCEEARKTRELSWAGFGFQVWLQIISHLVNASSSTILVVDEPEIYLHPDLQRRLFKLLRSIGKQIILATHSVEIINEAEHDEVVLINRARKSAKRVGDIDGLQDALFSIGSAQNIHLAKLSKDRRVLFLEGQDYKLLRKFASRAGLSALAEDVNLTIVPIGGFTQRQKIEDAAWTFEKVLRAEISIASLLDRDYRPSEEIDELLGSVREKIPNFFVLGSKEIENYLLNPKAISKALQERLRERPSHGNSGNTSPEAISDLLLECTEPLKSDVGAQLIAHRMRYFTGRSSLDPASLTAEALRVLEADWQDINRRLRIVPGKRVLASFNTLLADRFKTAITPTQIVRHMNEADLPQEFLEILRQLNAFAEPEPS